jgi:prepilin-type processing-associated H-X9-DG protein
MNQSPEAQRRMRRGVGFTLIELLVIMALTGLGALMLVPALARSKNSSSTLQCLNNLRQLQRAAAMYSADNNGSLAPNPGSFAYSFNAWCTGILDWNFGYGAGSLGESVVPNLNTNYLVKTLLGPYVAKTPACYKCPADRVSSAVGPRVRSYSMNAFVGAYDNTLSTTYNYGNYYLTFKNEADMARPGPAKTWVLMDEHPDSINDCYLVVNMPPSNAWPTYVAWDAVPASYHNNAGNLTFADGHVESHRWLDAQTLAPVLKTSGWSAGVPGVSGIGMSSVRDNTWLVARTSAPK